MLAGLGSIIGQAYGARDQAADYGGGRHPRPRQEPTGNRRGTDRVDLSDDAPKPLPTNVMRQAREAGEALTHSPGAAAEAGARLRMDRVMTAVAALSALNLENAPGGPYWPGGLPAPTGEELAAAYRRVCQRLADAPEAETNALGDFRRRLADRFRGADFDRLAQRLAERVNAETAANV